jgi:hypothetical protein
VPLPSPDRRSLVSRFFRNRRTGDVVVVQMPNLPLWVFLAATALRMLFRPHGSVGALVSIVATVSLGVWAGLEIARGDSPFRRVLGAVVLLAIVVGLVTR